MSSPRGGDLECLRASRDQVGRAERPVVVEAWGREAGRPGSPSGAPASAQAVSVAISAADSDRSCWNFGPTPGAGFHGGICRSSTTRGDVVGALAGLLVGLQRERPDLAAAMAFLAVLLEDRRDVLAVRRRRAGFWGSGIGQPTAATSSDGDRSTGQDGGDRVVQLAGARVGVPLLPRGELVVDPAAIADPSLARRSRTPRG